ncbi:hypothetical protein F5Y12DRAFT_428331 [Xylaria sp. FL1777]|nr:hypothetical protein F5Y12DRAFT_428331 [Xylaria sp. FL1777]
MHWGWPRQSPCFYSLCVGCGARLNGVLSNALRNYILLHTTDVFESSYQFNHVRADFMNLAFGSEARGSNKLLFSMLRNVFMTKDPSAPINILPEEKDAFKSQQDITAIHDAMQATTDKKKRRSLGSKMNNLIKTLSRLKLEEKRANYFNEANYLRACGLSTAVLQQSGGPVTVH